MNSISKLAAGVILSIITAAMPAGAQLCAGDCNADGVVEADELVRALDLWVHPAQSTKCAPADFDDNGAVEVDELLLAGRAFLGLGCGQPVAASAVTGPVVVEAGTALGVPGGSATIEVRLHVNGREVAGVENLLTTNLPSPLCFSSAMVNPSIDREATAFSIQGCDRLRAVVLSFTNLDPLPDGTVMYTVEIGIAPSAAPGFYPINVLEAGAADPNGNPVQSVGVAGGIFVGTAASTCGNAVVELDETCDDGNVAGGDGCAANCTHERSIVASFPQSRGSIQAPTFRLPLAFPGHQEMLIGSPRASDPNAIIPFVSMVSGTNFGPIPIPGQACVCMSAAQMPSTAPGVSGVGEFGCGVGGTSDGGYRRHRDHNTNDVDPTCSQGTADSNHFGVCNGPLLETRFGQGPAGSGISSIHVSLSLLIDQGQCTTAFEGYSLCPFPDYGADCLPCTVDDAAIAQTFSLALTTGTADAEIVDAANLPGRTIADSRACGSQVCSTQVAGAPFSCSELAFGDTVSTGAWAAAHPLLDSPSWGDNVLNVRLGGVAPTPSPTPTRTPTNTRTQTRTRTATPTATIPAADGSLILTRVRIKADTATRAGRDNGSISARGTVNVNDPFAGFIEQVLATGVSAIFSGAGGVQFTLAWTGPQCTERVTGRGPVVTCLGADRDRAVFKPSRVPNVFRMTIKAPRLDVQPPLTADPIFVELRTSSSRRIDSIAGCELRGTTRTTCRETGFVGTTPTPTRTPTATPTPGCPGDCNGNGAVTINELVQLINAGLSSGLTCPAADSDGSGSIDVTDGVRAVRAALMGCGGAPLPPPTPGAVGTVGVQAGSASGTVGGTATIEVRLQTGGLDVAAVENRLTLDTDAAICFLSCQANAGLGKDASVFAVETCRSVKAWIMGFNLTTIPNGALLYTCNVVIGSPPQPSSFSVPVTSVVTSDPRGFGLPSNGIAGGISVGTSAATLP